MRIFSRLVQDLCTAPDGLQRETALRHYFGIVEPADAAWAVTLLLGRKRSRLAEEAMLESWLQVATGLPPWLIRESLASGGEIAETAARLLPEGLSGERQLGNPLHIWMERLQALSVMDEQERMHAVVTWWVELDQVERWVFNRILLGRFRSPVSDAEFLRGLGAALEVEPSVLAARFRHPWQPAPESFRSLAYPDPVFLAARAYPFAGIRRVNASEEVVGFDPRTFMVAVERGGVPVQGIRRSGVVSLWSGEGEEISTDYAGICQELRRLPVGTVVVGQVEIQETANSPSFIVSDLLEIEGRDIREQSLRDRRHLLAQLLDDLVGETLLLSSEESVSSLLELDSLLQAVCGQGARGLVCKPDDSPYAESPERSRWISLRPPPLRIRGILLHAEVASGVGSRVDFTHYSVGLVRGEEILPVARASSSLSSAQQAELDDWIRQHTTARRGPVRLLKPDRIVEIEAIAVQKNSRRKAGYSLTEAHIVQLLPEGTDSPIDSWETHLPR